MQSTCSRDLRELERFMNYNFEIQMITITAAGVLMAEVRFLVIIYTAISKSSTMRERYLFFILFDPRYLRVKLRYFIYMRTSERRSTRV